MTVPGLRIILKKGIPTLLALGAGYAGGVLHTWLNQTKASATIRANRFELVDPSGKTVAFWTPNPALRAGGDAGAVMVFADPRGARRCEFGISGGNSAPFLRFYGEDRAERVGVMLGYNNDPVIFLRDSQKIRAVLGANHGDAPSPSEDQWGLSLRARKEGAGASIGFYRWWDDTYRAAVTLGDGANRTWEATAGGELKPVPFAKPRNR